MIFLRKQEVIDIQDRLIEEFGGSQGLRDEGVLESALSAGLEFLKGLAKNKASRDRSREGAKTRRGGTIILRP